MNRFAPHGTDGYKLGHAPMYPVGCNYVYSNMTPRSDRLFKGSSLYDGKMVVFGISGAVQELVENWNESFFCQPKEKVIKRYTRRINNYLGVGVVNPQLMADLWEVGYLPLIIKSLPEGSRISMKVPIMTIQSSLPKFYWVVNYLESVLSDMIWKSCTNATVAFEYKKLLVAAAIKTGSPLEGVQFQAHDFSMRGMSGPEDAIRSGAAHLTSFSGTDTVGAIDYVEDYYFADSDKELVGVSVCATEHAVSSSNILAILARIENNALTYDEAILYGKGKNAGLDKRGIAELLFLNDYITRIVPTGTASYVADTYGYWTVLTIILPILKDVITARNGKLVIRPDSGDPETIICGMNPVLWGDDKAYEFENIRHFYDFMDMKIVSRFEEYDCVKIGGKFYSFSVNEDVIDLGVDEIPYAVVAGSIRTLYKIFGGTVNEASFKELDSHIGLIYGDSITIERAEQILNGLADKRFASGNIVFGVGSYTYQYCTRDTFGFAVKATGMSVNGDFIEIYKDPATGDKLKKSAKGLLRVDLIDGEYVLKDQCTLSEEDGGELAVIYNGELGFWNGFAGDQLPKLSDIRKRLEIKE